jgi:hypothetical protein
MKTARIVNSYSGGANITDKETLSITSIIDKISLILHFHFTKHFSVVQNLIRFCVIIDYTGLYPENFHIEVVKYGQCV